MLVGWGVGKYKMEQSVVVVFVVVVLGVFF